MSFTPDESKLIFAVHKSERDIGILDLESFEITSTLRGHTNSIYSLALSPDGRHLASSTYKKELFVWRREGDSYEIASRFSDLKSNVAKIAFSPGSDYLAGAHYDDTISVWKLSEQGYSPHQHLAPKQYYGNTGYLHGLAFSPDGAWLAAGLRSELTLWKLQEDRYEPAQVVPDAVSSTIWSAAFSPDGLYLACGIGRGIVQLWRLRDGEWLAEEKVDGVQDYVRDLAFSPDGRRLAAASSGKNTVIFWELQGIGADPLFSLSGLTGSPYSKAQKAIIGAASSSDILNGLDADLLEPRDEFETDEEFEARQGRLRAQALLGLQRFTEQRYGVEQRRLAEGRFEISVPLEGLLSYDVGTESYTLEFMRTKGVIAIPRSEARTLKRGWQEAEIRIDKRIGQNGVSFEYDRFSLVHPANNKRYDISLKENPFLAVVGAAKSTEEYRIGPQLILRNLELRGIMPAFYRYYDRHPIGGVRVVNTGSTPIEGLRISMMIPRYMDNPKPCRVQERLAAGEKAEAELFVLLTNEVLEISEGDTVAGLVRVEYTVGGRKHEGEIPISVSLYDRNAVTWDDDRRVAAFVTAKDPAVLKYAKRIAGMARVPSSKALNQNMLHAMKLYEAMRASRLSYVIDPSTPYTEFSKNSDRVDFLQFPRQTLEYRAGDCDDLSVLYNTLLESVGVKTAFITVPGHIFTAFSLDMDAGLVKKLFDNPDSLLLMGGTAWVPVETTALDEGFLKAWEHGLRQWREHAENNEAAFFTTADAWKLFQPVSFGGAYDISLPDESVVTESFLRQLNAFRDQQIYAGEKKLLERIEETGGNARLINRLGLLYSRYGLYDNALQQFTRVLEKESYLPALMNRGNVYSVLGELGDAQAAYEAAARADPNNARVLIALTRIYVSAGDMLKAREAYTRLKALSPELARKFPLLETDAGQAGRASELGGEPSEVFQWEWE